MDFQFMVKNTCKNMVISFSFLIEYAIFFRVGYLHAFCHPILNEIWQRTSRKYIFFYSKSLKYIIYGH